tara:strand:- start:11410 stop:11649 length:240 start_codon:yes stop_codon:yes gene_type:complete
MTVKKFTSVDIEDIYGPMNSVSKADAEVWALQKVRSSDFSSEQIHRIEVAKKKKAVNSSKKQDRKNSKEIIRHLGTNLD